MKQLLLVASAALVVGCGGGESSSDEREQTAGGEDASPRVGVLVGRGGPALEELSHLDAALDCCALVAVPAGQPVDSSLRAVLVIDPTRPITEDDRRELLAYLDTGGSLGVFAGSRRLDLSADPPIARSVNNDVDAFVRRWGVEVGEGLVADERCAGASTPYPPAPIGAPYEADHPAIAGHSEVPLRFTSPLILEERFRALDGTALAMTSGHAWVLSEDPLDLSARELTAWPGHLDQDRYVLLVALEPPAADGGTSRVLIAGGGAILRQTSLPLDDGPAAASTLASSLLRWLARE